MQSSLEFMLHEFLTTHRQTIVTRTRARVDARTNPDPTESELENGVPLFLSQLIDRLRLATLYNDNEEDNEEMEETATLHGGAMLAMGFTVTQVIKGYGDVCQVVTELADDLDAPIAADEFQTFNYCLDEAIAHAVTEYQRGRDASVAYEETERLGALAHELRNRLGAAMLAFSILEEGRVAVGGSTGAVVKRSLWAMHNLITNALSDVRLDSGSTQRQRISVSALIADAEVEASMGTNKGGVLLDVSLVANEIDVEADEQILSAVLNNLLQNAFKFSCAAGHVALRTSATDARVLIEIEDECGGLPPGEAEDLFLPFSQRGEERGGVGLGLSISRKGVEAMGGTLSVRDLPGKGCVFAIDLPRLPAA